MKKLSVIIPAYNEERFIAQLLQRVLSIDLGSVGFEKEVIVVNDGSSDQTLQCARDFESAGVRCIDQVPNQGKGRAVQRGIAESTGDYILVQDADLEYDPRDYIPMLRALGSGADSIYGSRVLGQFERRGWSAMPGKHPEQQIGPWVAGLVLSCWTLMLYGRWITDTLTAYKIYPAAAIKNMVVETHGFETDHEITAKLIRGGYLIREVPISYQPRTLAEGKKIGAIDGLIALWTLVKYRFKSDVGTSRKAAPAKAL